MKKLVNCFPTLKILLEKNNIFAQVVRQDKYGHVRKYGFGICPTDVWGDKPSRSGSQRLVLDQKHELLDMKAKFARQEEQIKDQARELANMKAYLERENGHNFMNQSRITSTSSNHMSTFNSSLRPLKEGDYVSLFSLDEPTKIVAVGRLQSLDPSIVFGGQPLGMNWCEVLVQVMVERDEHLIRPYSYLQTVADSIGAPIAWPTKLVYGEYSEEIEILKEEVRSMLMTTDNRVMEKLNLIDIIEQLGISYHFAEEIEQQLEEIFRLRTTFDLHQQNYDLFTVSLHFRLMRQHGFHISCGIFNQFRDANGKFKESLITDINGLLSLYEATQVMTHGDNIFEEALAFTVVHLKCGMTHASSNLAKQVKYALTQAHHKGYPRIEARRYISMYEEDESHNQLLLRFAKLDYALLQMLHKQELSDLIRWENEIEFASQLRYARARVVESYFFALAIFFEPQYSLARVILAKHTVLLTGIDDTIDVYGTLDEIKSYTDAMERWDAKAIDELPSYMRISYLALLNFSDELDKQFTGQGRSYAFKKYKEAWIQYAKTSCIESGWFVTRELPSFPDYLSNGLVTGLSYILISTIFLAMETATEDVFNWLSNNPKIAVASAKICRLMNDIGSYESEKQRRATGIECYMKHYNISEQEVMKKFEEIAENAWKDINEEFLKPTTIPREILMRFLNLARILDVFYKHRKDGFTDPHKVLEPHIVAVLVDPIIV